MALSTRVFRVSSHCLGNVVIMVYVIKSIMTLS